MLFAFCSKKISFLFFLYFLSPIPEVAERLSDAFYDMEEYYIMLEERETKKYSIFENNIINAQQICKEFFFHLSCTDMLCSLVLV